MVTEQPSTTSFPAFRTIGAPKRSPLEKALSIFADVRAGEGVNALLLAANVFLLLGSYYVLKTAREALILTESTPEVKTYASAAQAGLLAVLIPFYGWLASRVGRGRLLTYSALFFLSNLVVFWILGTAGVREGIAYFIWTGIFNSFVVSQFWQFSNDLFSESQGKRLFPLIGIGSSLGAWLGSKAAGDLADTMSPYTFMVIGAAGVLLCLGLTQVVNGRMGQNRDQRKEEPLGREGGFELVRKDRYLLLIAFSVLLLNLVNTGGEYVLSKIVSAEADKLAGTGADFAQQRRAYIGHFYGQFFSWVNLVGFLFQTFLVSRLFRYVNVSGALFMLPLITLCGYTLMAIVPMVEIIRVSKVLENSTDYSVNNTTRHALFLNTSREAKYKAKAAIDTFFMRGGDAFAALVVYLAAHWNLGISLFSTIIVGIVVIWLLVCVQLARLYRQRSATA